MRWTAAETTLLKEIWVDGSKSNVRAITFELQRSRSAVLHKALELGLTKRLDRAWTAEQRDFLIKHSGHPIFLLSKVYNHHAGQKGWPIRSRSALKKELFRLGYGCSGDDYFSVNQIAQALKCSQKRVSDWAKHSKDILKPHNLNKPPKPILIHRNNLRAFILRFRGELDGLNPDPVWLVDLLCPNQKIGSS